MYVLCGRILLFSDLSILKFGRHTGARQLSGRIRMKLFSIRLTTGRREHNTENVRRYIRETLLNGTPNPELEEENRR